MAGVNFVQVVALVYERVLARAVQLSVALHHHQARVAQRAGSLHLSHLLARVCRVVHPLVARYSELARGLSGDQGQEEKDCFEPELKVSK